MSDDTATVELLARRLRYSKEPDQLIRCEAANELEQQARTIAEQAARLEAMERDAGRKVRYQLVMPTDEQCLEVAGCKLYEAGDMRLAWVNEGDIIAFGERYAAIDGAKT